MKDKVHGKGIVFEAIDMNGMSIKNNPLGSPAMKIRICVCFQISVVLLKVLNGMSYWSKYLVTGREKTKFLEDKVIQF